MLKRIKPFFNGVGLVLMGGLALGLVDALCQSLIPIMFREVLNALQADPGKFMSDHFGTILWQAVILVIVFTPSAYFFHSLVGVAAARICRNMQVSLHDHLLKLSSDFYQRNRVGEVTARVNTDMEVISASFGQMAGIVWSGSIFLCSTVFMLYINLKLSLLFLTLIIVVTVFSRLFMPRLRSLNREVRDATGHVSATVTEFIALHPLIKAFSQEGLASERVTSEADALLTRKRRLIWYIHAYGDTIQTLIKFVAPLSLLLIGATMIVADTLRAGDLVAFWGYWIIMGNSLGTILNFLPMLMNSLAAFDRIREFYDETPLVADLPDAIEKIIDAGSIDLKNISFIYPNTHGEGPALHQLSLSIPSGAQAALVGPSGSGKSTLLQLLLRFYDPDEGMILIDGVDIRNLRQQNLRRNIGVVLQESFFFSGTIRDNLRLGRPDASDEAMIEALQNAHAWEFIEKLPGQLDAVLGERGARLSGGQKQRLSIARVLLKNPRIVLLDEATSALDSVSEKLIQKAFERIRQGRTTLTVAHRIATVKNADIIFVLEAGQLIDRGSHGELIQRCPLYAELCQNQTLSTA